MPEVYAMQKILKEEVKEGNNGEIKEEIKENIYKIEVLLPTKKIVFII